SPDSVLNTCRRFVAWRRQHPALRAGNIRFIETPGNALAFVRESLERKASWPRSTWPRNLLR
ncbi:MAG: hypothetical protein WCA06_17485, partial [Terrimicrobiaceae bacterium]